MKFKGTIVITDPCYLDSGMNNEDNLDLWEASNYGEDLTIFGCSQWISENTLYGDWSCNTYKGTLDETKQARETWDKYYFTFFSKFTPDISGEERAKLREEYKQYEKQFKDKYTLGSFCADAGMVCVVYLDEILKVNPHFKEWADKHSWCVTIIENFDGDVEYEVDEEGEAHIVGKGNLNFYTSQSGF